MFDSNLFDISLVFIGQDGQLLIPRSRNLYKRVGANFASIFNFNHEGSPCRFDHLSKNLSIVSQIYNVALTHHTCYLYIVNLNFDMS